MAKQIHGNTLSDNAFTRMEQAVLAHEGAPTNGGRAPAPFNEHKPPIVAIAASAFGHDKPGTAIPCRWDQGLGSWTLAGGQKEFTIYCIPGGLKNKRDAGEILYCVHMPGVGYVALNEVYWVVGGCYGVLPYTVVGIMGTDDATPRIRPGGSSSFSAALVELANRTFSMTAFRVQGVQGTSGLPGDGAWNARIAFTMGFNPVLGAADACTSNDATEFTGPVPVTMQLPAWLTYSPNDGRVPVPGELWGIRESSEYLHFQPTGRRTVKFKHVIEVDIVLGEKPGASSGADPCNCAVESTTVTVDPYTETFVYGWVVNEVDEEAGLCQVLPFQKHLELTTSRSGSIEEYEFNALANDAGTAIIPVPDVLGGFGNTPLGDEITARGI